MFLFFYFGDCPAGCCARVHRIRIARRVSRGVLLLASSLPSLVLSPPIKPAPAVVLSCRATSSGPKNVFEALFLEPILLVTLGSRCPLLERLRGVKADALFGQ